MSNNDARLNARRMFFCLVAVSLLSLLQTLSSIETSFRVIGSSGLIAYDSEALISISSNNPVAPSVPFKIDGSNYHPNGTEYLDGEWNWYTITAGTHTVEMPSPWTNPSNQITYYFETWDDGVASNPRTITLTEGEETSFYALYTETPPPPPPGKASVTIGVMGGGTTNLSPGNYIYDAGVTITLNAMPNANNEFDHWTESISGDGIVWTSPLTVNENSTSFVTEADTYYRWTAFFSYSVGVWRPYNDNSLYNIKIPANVAYRADSQYIFSQSRIYGTLHMGLDDWMPGIWDIDTSTGEGVVWEWRYIKGIDVPVPINVDTVTQAQWEDSPIIINDWNTYKSYQAWQWTGWDATWLEVYPDFINGDGYGGGGGACGNADLAGLLRPEEVEAGLISHMLSIHVGAGDLGKYCNPPAVYGVLYGPDGALPAACRIQLNPAYDITWLSEPAQVIAKALQEYGAFPSETTGASGWRVEMEWGGSVQWRLGYGWSDIGVYWDMLDGIPLSEFRVLEYGQKDANGNWIVGDLYG